MAECNYDLCNEEEYRKFGEPYDRLILKEVRDQAQITILLAQGHKIMFDRIAAYPVDGLNWHDRPSAPSLKES